MVRRRRRRPVARAVSGLAIVVGLAAAGVGAVRLVQVTLLDPSPDVVLVTDAATAAVPPSTVPPALAAPVAPPLVLRIDDLGLDGYVRSIGVEPDGELEVPDETEIGWYRHGAVPGREGATVLAAHVSWNRTAGPFHRLGEIELGARVEVVVAGGRTRAYEVVERALYDKDELPADRIWRTTGDEELVLITCGGEYDSGIRRYRQNIVVYAVPVADA